MKNKLLTKEFHEVFLYDLNSSSGLTWNIDIFSGKHRTIHKVVKGSFCDHISKAAKRYVVMYKGKNYAVSRIVYFLNFPDMDQSLIVDHRDGNPLNNNISNLRLVSNLINSRNIKKRDSTEITGVDYRLTNGYGYWRARYQTKNKLTVEKLFSCLILGFEKAKELAITFRKEGIINENLDGAGYTERHGK